MTKEGELHAAEPEQDRGGIRHLLGSAEALPEAVTQLGRPRSVHQPTQSTGTLRRYRTVLLAAGAVMLLVPPLLLPVVPTSVGLPLLLICLAGVLCVALPFLSARATSVAFMVYRDVLVAVEGNSFTIIPWANIPEFCLGADFKTSEGRDYPLPDANAVSDGAVLIQALMDRVRDCRVLPAVTAVRSGETVTFGPFAVNAQAIGHAGRVERWDEMTRLTLPGPTQRDLVIQMRGALVPWTCSLEGVPNAFVLLDVIKQVCPPHLRAPARATVKADEEGPKG